MKKPKLIDRDYRAPFQDEKIKIARTLVEQNNKIIFYLKALTVSNWRIEDRIVELIEKKRGKNHV